MRKQWCNPVFRRIIGTLRLTATPHALAAKNSTLTSWAVSMRDKAFSGKTDSNIARAIAQTKKNPANGR